MAPRLFLVRSADEADSVVYARDASSESISILSKFAKHFVDTIPGPSSISPLAARSDPSGLEPRAIQARSTYVSARSMTAGILVVFCLLGASLGLLCFWLFIRHGGFIWKKTDWEDYKSSVLRRPEARPDDAVTVFSDGSARRHRGGSTLGTRTVVLGELDTTYSKAKVTDKPWGPRDMKPKKKKGLGSVWGTGDGSLWGRIRGGDRSDTDTQIQREKELSRETESEVTATTFVDNQEPARPAGWKPGDSDLHGHYGGGRNETVIRHPPRAQAKTPLSDTSYVGSSSDSDTDSDDSSSIDESQIGMAKGTKVYSHPLPITSTRAPMERNGGGAGGTYGGGASVMNREAPPRGSGYRVGSSGSLSSEGSLRSSAC
ncbi:hypothetical protein RUND412_010854 [Rhizina undulata]